MSNIKTGPKVLKGSEIAKRKACMILEVLSGLQSPTTACKALGSSISRYYIMETQAIQGMISALEPKSKGPKKTAESELKKVITEKEKLEKELTRAQSLIRTMHRSIGLSQANKVTKKKGKKILRKRKNQVRGKRIVEELESQISDKYK